MKRLFAALLIFCFTAAFAQKPTPPDIIARSYLLMDVTANQQLVGRGVDNPVEPASLTKLMTVYLVFESLRNKKVTLSQTFPVSERAAQMKGSRMFVDKGTKVPVEDLLKGAIVQSGNDAVIALAEGVGGSVDHFVELMNAKAQELGMKATTYKNPEGLTTKGHLSTARDLSVLAMRLMHDFPEYIHYYAIKKYRYPGTPVANENNRNTLLLLDPTVDGLKTGHTTAAGFCLIATAKRDAPNFKGRRLLSVVLGAGSEKSRASESQKLLNWGYTAYEDVKLFDADQPVVTPRIWKGSENTIKLGRNEPLVVSIPTGMTAQIKTQVTRPEPLFAPFAKGQNVGTMKVSLGAAPWVDVPLNAIEAVEEAGWFGRTWDSMRMWMSNKSK